VWVFCNVCVCEFCNVWVFRNVCVFEDFVM